MTLMIQQSTLQFPSFVKRSGTQRTPSELPIVKRIGKKQMTNELPINQEGVYDDLIAGEADAWSVLLAYVQKQVQLRLRNRPLPNTLSRTEMVEEYTAEACQLILEELQGYKQRSHLSAYLNSLVQTALVDRNYKNLIESVQRFLAVVRDFPFDVRETITATIADALLDENEKNAIYHAINHTKQTEDKQVFHRARRKLLRYQPFETVLNQLRHDSLQAKTVLIWLDASRPTESLVGENNEPIELPDSRGDTVFNAIIEREEKQGLLICLERLKLQALNQWEVIIGRYIEDLSYKELSRNLGVQQNTLVKRHQRAITNLKQCLESE